MLRRERARLETCSWLGLLTQPEWASQLAWLDLPIYVFAPPVSPSVGPAGRDLGSSETGHIRSAAVDAKMSARETRKPIEPVARASALRRTRISVIRAIRGQF